MTKNIELSTQVGCEETWRATVGKESFDLTSEQVEVIKKATKEGNRGIVWFDKLGISIPHIQSITRIRKEYYKVEGSVMRVIGKREYDKLSRILINK